MRSSTNNRDNSAKNKARQTDEQSYNVTVQYGQQREQCDDEAVWYESNLKMSHFVPGEA